MPAKRFLILSAVILLMATSTVQAGAPPATQADRDPTHWADILNTLYGVGCATGTVAGSAVGFAALAYSSFVVSYAIVGCALGMLAGPVGLFVRDAVTGDDAAARYAEDVGWSFQLR